MGFDFDELSNEVIAAAIQVHRALGPGFLEGVYEQALRVELTERGLHNESQKLVRVEYRGHVVGNHVLDLVVEDKLIVELKAVAKLEEVHFAQVRSYLRATGFTVGLLMNFNSPRLEVKRIVFRYEPEGQPATLAEN